MKLKTLALAALTAISALLGTGCTPQQGADNSEPQSNMPKEITNYEIDGNTVVEFPSPGNPSQIIVAVDGYEASGIVSFERDSTQKIGTPVLLNHFNTAAGDIYEFTPASNKNVICTYVDSYKSGALTYSVKK